MTEIRGDQSALISRELPSGQYGTHLSPLEHAIFGSTVTVNGELLNIESVLEDGDDLSLMPLGIRERSVDQIKGERKGAYLDGYFSVFEPDRVLIMGDYMHRLWLPELDEKGRIKPKFSVQLLAFNSNTGKYEPAGSVGEDIASKVEVEEGMQKHFSLDKQQLSQTGEMTLSYVPKPK